MFHYEGTKASEPICICIWCLLCNDIFKKMLLKISLTYPLGIVKIFMVSHLGRNCLTHFCISSNEQDPGYLVEYLYNHEYLPSENAGTC